ncbi:transcription factor IBH1-like [Juglans microcarpa x Juglans regia]|uniref:transcription factor IBH1-like n=1 Tax=Juglans microcarpa x Juglans regia TaxID=2249226 RepID=UPI001B7E756E|nr:transcription factor IBH1-like [Juglans microcarpa x Juglans regia]XP_041010266.1 transcription factor IBH1-like [Juglans microcarpa x Juglans regia]
MIPKGVSLNPNSRKTRFARRFICALSQMRNPRPVSSSNEEEVRKRSHKIKIAAYLSMARAVGSRRAWSRALLFKLRTRARRHNIMIGRRSLCLKKKRVIKNDPLGELSQTNKLRHLVPGGKTMDMCSLLEETAHFVTCLATQVKVMQTIADHFAK